MSHQQAGPDREPARRFIAADHARAASPYANVSSAVHKTLPVARRTAMCQRRKNVIAGPLRSAVRRPTAGLPPRRTLGCERGLRRSVGQQRRRRSRPDGSRCGLSWPFRGGRRRAVYGDCDRSRLRQPGQDSSIPPRTGNVTEPLSGGAGRPVRRGAGRTLVPATTPAA